jgi:hypothetical protein
METALFVWDIICVGCHALLVAQTQPVSSVINAKKISV